MVVGNGMVARLFESYVNSDKFVVFASGVSNSKTIAEDAYRREMDLLQETIKSNPEKTFIYFSTCSVYDPALQKSRYVLHKLEVENTIARWCKSFHIFRVSNLAGKSGNRNTILNFFVYHIQNGINFDLWENATRNLIDVDDMFKIVNYVLHNSLFQNQVTNIANPENYTTKEIISSIETIWNIRANYVSINEGSAFNIDLSPTVPIIRHLGIHFGNDYLVTLLRKYYHHQ